MTFTFVEAVVALAAFIFEYKLGCSGEGGKSDCIGLVIGALDMMGIKWGGTHGTNYAIRYRCHPPSVISGASSLSVGDLVFKRRLPGESGYALPSSYRNDADQNDYYHVGVVCSTNPLQIYHCSTGGIHIDTKVGKWAVHTTLTILPAEQTTEERSEPTVARTYFVSGGNTAYPIRMRKTASTSAAVIAQIPQNTVVDYLSVNGGWSKVIYNGQTGFVQSQYVHSTESGTVDTTFVDPVTSTVRDKIDAIAKLAKELDTKTQALLDEIGRG